ncbi:hypothetical protein L1987_68862 [Smallanthus sonchifolius]|nr:hypothetical protein L1987_68862 [Smallanthus sonchifolius]
MWNRSVQYWTSGSWNDRDHLFSLVPEMRLNYIYNFSYIDNENESYFTYSLYNPSIISRFIIDVSGQIQQLSWLDSTGQWNLFWSQPRVFCEVYGACGAFGVCNPQMMPFCSCLTDFEPRSQNDWNLGSYSNGCVRNTELYCSKKSDKPVFTHAYVEKRFLSAFPENKALPLEESECRNDCLDYCICNAYTFISNICQHWNREDLNNIPLVPFSHDSNIDTIYIKVSSSDHRKTNNKLLVAGIVSGFLGLVFLCSIGVVFYRRMKNQDPWMLSEEDRKVLDVPFFDFKRIVSATENFSLANKLGQGGFGPVYMGIFPGGAEMAHEES